MLKPTPSRSRGALARAIPTRPRRLAFALAALALALGHSATSAWAVPMAKLLSLDQGVAVLGTPVNEGFAGTFNISIDGGPTRQGYCVDLNNGIGIGDMVPQVGVDYPIQVTYILNNAFPQPNTIGTPLSPVKCEAAAVQCSIWSYTDNYQCTSSNPSSTCPGLAARVATIISTANANAAGAIPPVPQSLTLSPPSATNELPGDQQHTVTANLLDDNAQPLGGYTIDISVQTGPGAGNSNAPGGASPTTGLTYNNAVAGTDTIKATVAYTIPTGQKFKDPNKQGIVLAGPPVSGTLTATATKNWITAVCGDGVVNAGEQCDDGNANNNDSCTNQCLNARCGDGYVGPGEQCDDGNTLDADACHSSSTPGIPATFCKTNVCGDEIRDPATEQCDDGNNVNNDGCTNQCKLPFCGDGIQQTGEQCDDGNTNNNDACTNQCKTARCGDGITGPGEQCDDGNTVNDDACTNACTTARCGDGIQQAGEQCDDGNAVNNDACTNACTTPRCGDGIQQAGEQCDDGNQSNTDACTNACNNAVCGDGFVGPGETCDDGDQIDTNACKTDCTENVCGDGIVEAGVEACDDGNQVNTDGCTNLCTLPACGDGFVQAGEECDDGNQVNTDACTNACTTARCGDGVVGPGEACDDGNQSNLDSCTNTCQPKACGDGFVQPPEVCDDGNQVNTDACTNACALNVCGDGIPGGPGEACDDGNQSNTDGCTNTCKLPACGDGFVQAGEQCDDGNQVNTDACTNACTTARCGDAIVGPDEQCDDGNQVNDDGCTNTCLAGRCGDGIVQPALNEECDDGNNINGDGCSATCAKQDICENLTDDDGDGLVDCDDPDCECLEVEPVCKHPCPATITLSPNAAKPDVLKFQTSFSTSTPLDPAVETVKIAITNANGIVYAAQLVPGDLVKRGSRQWIFKDPLAAKGLGSRGGLSLVKVITKAEGNSSGYRINVKAFGGLDLATLPEMTLQFVIAGNSYQKTATWSQTARGWKVNLE